MPRKQGYLLRCKSKAKGTSEIRFYHEPTALTVVVAKTAALVAPARRPKYKSSRLD
jgi:hypothetical protein